VADYLKGSQHIAGAVTVPGPGPGSVLSLPSNLLANIASAQATSPPLPRHAPPPLPQQHHHGASHAQQQQQLLASAQLLASVNPGLAAAAMAQALNMANAASVPAPVPAVPAPAPQTLLPRGMTAADAPAPRLVLQNHSQAVAPPQPQPQQLGTPASHQVSSTAIAQYRQQLHNMNQEQVQPTNAEALHQVSSGSSNNDGSGDNLTQSGKKGSKYTSSAKPSVAVGGHHGSRSCKNPQHPLKAMSAPTASSMTALASLPSLPGGLSTHRSGGHGLSSGALVVADKCQGSEKAAAAAVSSTTAAASSSAPSSVPISMMQKWSLEQLEVHVKQLSVAQQSIPQAVALLLGEMRRKEEKRHAKRLANRKSACTSRARKKALIEEMTKDNARLRRQALILSYLPDPVVTISTEGIITFCSMQVERVLKHDVSSLIGANIEDIIVPSSRDAIRRLIRDLVIAEQRVFSSSVEDGESASHGGGGNAQEAQDGRDGGIHRDVHLSHPHEVSEHSSERGYPPLLEVKVNAGLTTSAEVAAAEDVSDSSGDPPSKNGQGKASDIRTEVSSLTHKTSVSGDNSNSNDDRHVLTKTKKGKASIGKSATCLDGNKKLPTTESDDSTSSENKANANLTKNVERCKLNKNKIDAGEVQFSHKDDVMGASVTANNADAKLSSLMHNPRKKDEIIERGGGVDLSTHPKRLPEQQQEQVVPSIRWKHVLGPKKQEGEESASSADSSSVSKLNNKKCGHSSEDSGYRQSPEESNEYQEDSLSSSAASSDRSSKKKQRRMQPLAPACNIRLIRNDLSTIWCELTSSIRTRPLNDVDKDLNIVPPSHLKQGGSSNRKNNNSLSNSNNDGSNESAYSIVDSGDEEKELLLCFRPIREGDIAAEELRFCPKKVAGRLNNDGLNNTSSEEPKVSASTNLSSSSGAEGVEGNDAHVVNKPTTSNKFPPSLTETQVAIASPASTWPVKTNRPPKKRKVENQESEHSITKKKLCGRKIRNTDETKADEPDEKSAVESMMELAMNLI